MKNLLSVPILFKGRSVGNLYVADKIDEEGFSEEDREVLILLANHAAIAIENSRLYEVARDAERTRQIERTAKEMTTRILQAQEQERKRIARELHDETAQSLSTILITLDLYEPFLPVDNDLLRKGFDRVRELARRTLDETRALSHNLRPTILDDVGLVAALEWYADEHLHTFGVPVEVHAETVDNLPLTPDQDIAIFRIAQEALNNSGKYAEASKASVSLTVGGQTARLVIEDDGKGFDTETPSAQRKDGGFGLYGMRERTALLDGTLTVESTPGEGTRITAMIPLPGEPMSKSGTAAPSDMSSEQSESHDFQLEARR
jgi:signal transduction histidine kinase